MDARKYPYCDYELESTSDWNYAFSDLVFEKAFAGIHDVPFSSMHPPVSIRANMVKIPWGFEPFYDSVCAETSQARIPISEEQEMQLIPYGCAKLRMTGIPLI